MGDGAGAECPNCGEVLTVRTGRLEGGVTRADVGAILTCRDCGQQWQPDADGRLRAYRWAG
jgi:hypothetical protein